MSIRAAVLLTLAMGAIMVGIDLNMFEGIIAAVALCCVWAAVGVRYLRRSPSRTRRTS